MPTVAELNALRDEIMSDTELTTDQREYWRKKADEQLAAISPKGAIPVSTPNGMRPVGATVDGVRYEPEAEADLADRKRMLEQAGMVASRYSIPFIKVPQGTNAQGVVIPPVIDRRPGTVADFMSGSNPYESYTYPDPQVVTEEMTGIPVVVPNGTPRPAMYFGRDVPAVPVSQQDYMNVMDLSNRAATIPNVTPSPTPGNLPDSGRRTGYTDPIQLPPISPTPTPMVARVMGTPSPDITPYPTPTPRVAVVDPFAGEVPTIESAGVIDPLFLANDKRKKIDREVAVQFLDQAGNDLEKARKLAGDAGYFW